MPATKQYKDFGKEAKDLLTKNFPAAGTWKIETKDKGPDRTIIISPVAESKNGKTSIAVDVDYNLAKEYSLKTKTNISTTGIVKPKITYDVKPGHKVEATLMNLTADADFEITYEGEFAGAVVYDKLTKKGGEAQVAYGFGALTVGAGVAWAFEKGLTGWTAGVRYSDKLVTASLITAAAKIHTLSVWAPIPNQPLTAGFTVVANNNGTVTGATVAVEATVSADTKARVKADYSGVFSIAIVKKFVNGWTGAFTVESKDFTKFGVQLTRE